MLASFVAAVACHSGAIAAPADVCPVSSGAPAPAPTPAHAAFRILVFSRTTGFHHASIPAAITAVEVLGSLNNFAVDATEDPTVFTDANLVRFAAVVFLNTTGDVLDSTQQAAFERYVRAGHGFVGVHSAFPIPSTTGRGITPCSAPRSIPTRRSSKQASSWWTRDSSLRARSPTPGCARTSGTTSGRCRRGCRCWPESTKRRTPEGRWESSTPSAGSMRMTAVGRGIPRWVTRRAATASGRSSITCSAGSCGRRGFPELKAPSATVGESPW